MVHHLTLQTGPSCIACKQVVLGIMSSYTVPLYVSMTSTQSKEVDCWKSLEESIWEIQFAYLWNFKGLNNIHHGAINIILLIFLINIISPYREKLIWLKMMLKIIKIKSQTSMTEQFKILTCVLSKSINIIIIIISILHMSILRLMVIMILKINPKLIQRLSLSLMPTMVLDNKLVIKSEPTKLTRVYLQLLVLSHQGPWYQVLLTSISKALGRV